ncbi:MAG TPA: glycosyltransferase family 2 protein, partial [Candidatus Krumholzibacterium sp.]|nr:glycosyltransferase family 2 protein [Candidatus Krumholzibacterium sp.]
MIHEKYAAVIPAYNEERHIAGVLEELKRYFPAGNIVVIDDGSSDETAAVCAGAGVWVIRHNGNRGKGAALRTGFAALVEKEGLRGIFTLDADGQHDPSEIASFVEHFERTGADIIIGDRM